jgi:hypothetical protein
MTPLQAAKAECDNCDSASNCSGTGIRIEPNGHIKLYRFREEGGCWLVPDAGGNIKRCQHFEGILIPTAKNRARAAVTQEQKHAAAKLTQAVHAYEIAVMPVQTAKYAKCRGCQRDVIAPKRLCEQCAKNRTLKSKRQYWSKTRKNGAVEALITNDL